MSNNKKTQKDDILQMEMSLIEKYKKPFLIACVAVIAVVATCTLYMYYSEKSNNEAQEKLFAGEEYFRAGDYQTALNGDSLGYAGFIALSEGSTPAANMACYYAGMSYAQMEKWEEAKVYLEKFDTQDDTTISPAAIRTLAHVYDNLDNQSKAASLLEKAAKMADGGSIAPVCLMEAVILYEKMGNTDKAVDLLNKIKAEYPQTMQGAQVEKYLLRLGK